MSLFYSISGNINKNERGRNKDHVIPVLRQASLVNPSGAFRTQNEKEEIRTMTKMGNPNLYISDVKARH